MTSSKIEDWNQDPKKKDLLPIQAMTDIINLS